eukprot:TRINITY_DN5185_c0_g1_i1.p1 TRINITY_DN5185_c0_g1~~TRINITY_DN5185_c0_g1_i1.p1  ORF type:complete len:886 (+),score=242.94 TRINITY_DN5185_c0_g1_i1:3-2660(+)
MTGLTKSLEHRNKASKGVTVVVPSLGTGGISKHSSSKGKQFQTPRGSFIRQKSFRAAQEDHGAAKAAIKFLSGRYNWFSKEWDGQSDEAIERSLSEITYVLQRHRGSLDPSGSSPSGSVIGTTNSNRAGSFTNSRGTGKSGPISIDGKSQDELDDLVALRDFNEWKTWTVGYSMKKMQKAGSYSRAIGGASQSANDTTAHRLLQSVDPLGEASVMFIIDANGAMIDKRQVLSLVHRAAETFLTELSGIIKAAEDVFPDLDENTEKILDSCITNIAATGADGKIDNNVIMDASSPSSLGILINHLSDKVYSASNRVRVDMIHLIATVKSIPSPETVVTDAVLLYVAASARAAAVSVTELLDTVSTLRHLHKKKSEETTAEVGRLERELDSSMDLNVWKDDTTGSVIFQKVSVDKKKKKKKEKEREKGYTLTKSIRAKKDQQPIDLSNIWCGVPWDLVKRRVKAASFNRLVELLTKPPHMMGGEDTTGIGSIVFREGGGANTSFEDDSDEARCLAKDPFFLCFITTYRSFTTPERLFEKLCQRFDVPHGMGARNILMIQQMVLEVIESWVERQFEDFDENLIKMLQSFLVNIVEKTNHKESGKRLRQAVEQNQARRAKLMRQRFEVPPTDLSTSAGGRSPVDLFMALNNEEIARQMTLNDFHLYGSIMGSSELLNQAWNKEKLKHRAPHVVALLERLNRISFWVPMLVCLGTTVKKRSEVYTKFVSIAEHLHRMNNFNSLMGIVAGLNMSSISRMKHTKAGVNPKVSASFLALEKLMHPTGSFKSYRAALRRVERPAIPYLGMYLTDLTFIEDGNPEQVDGLVNFEKREMVYNVLAEISWFQELSYNFPDVEPINTFLYEVPNLDDKELYNLSLKREPRNAKLEDIL